jgi:K+ transporter
MIVSFLVFVGAAELLIEGNTTGKTVIEIAIMIFALMAIREFGRSVVDMERLIHKMERRLEMMKKLEKKENRLQDLNGTAGDGI